MKNSRLNWKRTLHRPRPWIKTKQTSSENLSMPHIFIRKKGVNLSRSAKLVNAFDFSDACNRLALIKSLFTRLYCQIIVW